jgi:hypothetical protein
VVEDKGAKGKVSLEAAVREYLEEVKFNRAHKTHLAYKRALGMLVSSNHGCDFVQLSSAGRILTPPTQPSGHLRVAPSYDFSIELRPTEGNGARRGRRLSPSLIATVPALLRRLGGRAMVNCDFKAHHWKYLYRAAVFETHKRLMLMRISEAQNTIVDRINELSHETGFDVELEREALDDALYALAAWRTALEQRTDAA